MKTTIVFLLTALLPGVATIFAQDAEGTCGDNLTWRLSNGTLTISGTGDMTDYSYNYPWPSNIETVIIEDGVTSIGNRAFGECEYLTSVRIANSVTSIGEAAFIWCESLTTVTIPADVTSIGEQAFTACNNLTSVTIPEKVTNIGEMAFANCRSLTAINVSENNMAYASESGVLFDKAKSVLFQYPSGKQDATYTIPQSVTDIRFGAFLVCHSLTAIHVSEDNISYASENGVLFNKAKTVLIQYPTRKPDADYAIPNGVTDIGYGAFAFCSNLTSVTIPFGVTDIGEATFTFCENLITIAIPNSVTGIGDSAFEGCFGLTSVTIPESVTEIGNYTFADCSGLVSVTNLNPSPQEINYSVFYGIDFSNATLFVPVGSIEAYGTAAGWQNFRIEAYVPLAFDAPSITNVIRVYLDPATESLRIEGLTAPAQVTVNNANGQTLLRQTVRNGESISAAHLPQGIYLVNVNGKTIKTIKN
jgi:hypothetical protein